MSIIKVDCQVAISEPNTESHMLRPHNEATQCDPALRATRHRRRCRPRRGLSPLPYSSHTHPCARSSGSSPSSEIDSPGIISIVRHWRMSAALFNLFFLFGVCVCESGGRLPRGDLYQAYELQVRPQICDLLADGKKNFLQPIPAKNRSRRLTASELTDLKIWDTLGACRNSFFVFVSDCSRSGLAENLGQIRFS